MEKSERLIRYLRSYQEHMDIHYSPETDLDELLYIRMVMPTEDSEPCALHQQDCEEIDINRPEFLRYTGPTTMAERDEIIERAQRMEKMRREYVYPSIE